MFFTGVPFPKNFLSIAKTILKRLFRVYAHIYHQHFTEVVQLGEEAHLNTSFKHFIFFVQVMMILVKIVLSLFIWVFTFMFVSWSWLDRKIAIFVIKLQCNKSFEGFFNHIIGFVSNTEMITLISLDENSF